MLAELKKATGANWTIEPCSVLEDAHQAFLAESLKDGPLDQERVRRERVWAQVADRPILAMG